MHVTTSFYRSVGTVCVSYIICATIVTIYYRKGFTNYYKNSYPLVMCYKVCEDIF